MCITESATAGGASGGKTAAAGPESEGSSGADASSAVAAKATTHLPKSQKAASKKPAEYLGFLLVSALNFRPSVRVHQRFEPP